jgi:hypothetical protein
MKNVMDIVLKELDNTLSRSQNYGFAPKVFAKSDEKFEQYLLSHRSIIPCTYDKNPHYGFYNGRHCHASVLYGDFCSRLPKKMKGQFIRGIREGRFVFYTEYFDTETHEYIIDTKFKPNFS